MELDHEFTVPVPLDQAWPVLLDVERVAPCMPGATLDSVEADEFTGRLKVKLGAMTITYKGTARFASRDETTHTVTIEGTGKEARGAGTASAAVQARLHDEGERTRVTVHTKLNVTGRPAQFGRNILAEVGGKLVGRFAGNLAAELSGEEAGEKTGPPGTATPAAGTPTAGAPAEGTLADETPAAARPTAATEPATGAEPQIAPAEFPAGDGTPQATPEPATRRPARSDDAIDLLEFAGPSVAKRVVPVIVGLAVLWALWRLLRRSRH